MSGRKVLAALFAVVLGALTLPAQAGALWRCAGPVRSCTSADHHPGHSYDCVGMAGIGDTEALARGAAGAECAVKLRAEYGGIFVCSDTSTLRCRISDPGASKATPIGITQPSAPRPIEGCHYQCRATREQCEQRAKSDDDLAACRAAFAACSRKCDAGDPRCATNPQDDTCLLRCNQAEERCRKASDAETCEAWGDKCRKRCKAGFGPDPLPW